MSLNPTIEDVTARIIKRSAQSRAIYLSRMAQAAEEGPRRGHLTCGNQAHAYAAMGADKGTLTAEQAPNLGIVTSYNDMLSAHQPFETYPQKIKESARKAGGTAQVAGGVPAMCDGVTQGQVGMELSLFSRDVIALSAGVALSHNTFDAAVYLGVCDKIVPGLIIAAATFGYLPGIFIPAGPMTSGIPNDEKTAVRKRFAKGECDRAELMAAEMASYHGPGTCTFYGIAMARAAGVLLELEDLSDISDATPLMARVYPNGLADVNHFHAAGGLGYMIGELLSSGHLHPDTKTVHGNGLKDYHAEPQLKDGTLSWGKGATKSENEKILRPVGNPFSKDGGLKQLSGNLGRAVIKTSAVDPDRHIIEAPARVFSGQAEVKEAWRAHKLDRDCVIVVRFQGPKANGMPELHGRTPTLSVLQDRGFNVALVTDGRMSGASGKVPAAIHVSPEALDGGLIAKVQDGDIIRVDAVKGTIEVLTEGVADRPAAMPDLSDNGHGIGRELFESFRQTVGRADQGAGVVV